MLRIAAFALFIIVLMPTSDAGAQTGGCQAYAERSCPMANGVGRQACYKAALARCIKAHPR